MSWTAGTEVSGYEIKRLLGAGGMGEVYLARNVRVAARRRAEGLAGVADPGF